VLFDDDMVAKDIRLSFSDMLDVYLILGQLASGVFVS
jgi:hypothetical protein